MQRENYILIMETKLIIPNSRETLAISISELLYIEAGGNYSTLWLTNKPPVRASKEKDEGTAHNKVDITVAMQLGDIEKIIIKSDNQVRKSLVRVGRSYIINFDYLFKIDLTNSTLHLMDSDHNIYRLEDVGRDKLVELKKQIEK